MASRVPVCLAPAPAAEHAVPESPSEIPGNSDDPEQARRIQETRKKNDKFWKDLFIETGVRRYRGPVEENVWKQRLTSESTAFLHVLFCFFRVALRTFLRPGFVGGNKQKLVSR